MAAPGRPHHHAPPATDFPLPPVLALPCSAPPSLVTQGAEARLYRTTYLLPSLPCALKYRPPKPWRHPALDARLTRQRILAEARVLARCRREGVAVPAVYCVDEAAGWMMMEWVAGPPVRAAINAWLEGRAGCAAPGAAGEEGRGGQAAGEGENAELVGLLRRVGEAVGRLHRTGVVHGDLTTSNMMLRPWRTEGVADGEGAAGPLEGEVVIIDFGLASQSSSDEDRAVDLYVLERAFGSTHPRAEGLFTEVLAAYGDTFKQAVPALRKLEDVRMRGRKRSMLG